MLEFGLRIGEILVRQGLVDAAQVEEALSSQVTSGGRIGTNLVELAAVSIDTLAEHLGQQHDVPVADTTMLDAIEPETLRIVPGPICSKYGVIPLRYESPSQLHLAMLDPQKLDLLDEVGSILGMAVVHPYLVPELRLHHYLEKHYEIPRPKRFLRFPVDQERIGDERRSYLQPTVTPDDIDIDLDFDEEDSEQPDSAQPESRTTGDFEIVLNLASVDEQVEKKKKKADAGGEERVVSLDEAFADFEDDVPPPPGVEKPAPASAGDDDAPVDGLDEAFADFEDDVPPPPGLEKPASPPATEAAPTDDDGDDLLAGFDDAFSDDSAPPPSPAPAKSAPPPIPAPAKAAKPAPATDSGDDEEDAVDRLEQAEDREDLIELMLQPLVPEADLSIFFLLRDDMAVAAAARGTDLSKKEVSTLVVPVSMSEPLQRALAERNVVRMGARGDAMQQIIASFLGRPLPREACLVPITFEGKVVNLLCVQSGGQFSEDSLETLALVSVTASHTYHRLKPRAEHAPARARTTEVPAVAVAEPSGSTSISGSASVSGSVSMTLEESISGVSDIDLPAPEEDGSRPARQLKLIPARQRKFGRYTLICRLASGGMANLYLAQLAGKEGFEKLVAIKRIHEHLGEEDQFIRMFVDEARLAARISHPNVAQVIELDRFEDAHFIAMEYVDGEGLHALLRTARPRIPLVARIVAHAAAGLHAAHELQDQQGNPMGVVHRDVSPQNILISYQGAVKVVDFGVARARGNLHQTNIGTVKGKLSYMSPEQVQSGPVDRRADVFSLGIVLYEATTFRRLFKGSNEVATMHRVVEGEITPPSELRKEYPPELEEIVMKALQRDRTKRYQSAEELQAALEMFIMGSGSLVLASALGKLMKKTFHDNIREKRRVLREFEKETAAG